MLRLATSLALSAALVSACTSKDAPTTAASAPSSTSEAPAPVDGGSGVATSGDDAGPGTSTSALVAARPYTTKRSSKYDGSVAVPLVVSLHGYGGNAAFHEAYFKLGALAESKNFLLATPNGTKDKDGNQFWNASDACCDFYGNGVDDVAYLKAVIDDMKARFNVDAKRVYVVGHSNGGFMAHRLACELSGEIAAIVSLAGGAYADASRCKPTEPVAVLQVHGDADAVVSYAGGSLLAGAKAFPGAKATVATWAAKNGCGATLDKTGDVLDLDTKLLGAETTVARHACTDGAAELWTIAGGSHIPSFDASWAPSLYAFLEAHPKK